MYWLLSMAWSITTSFFNPMPYVLPVINGLAGYMTVQFLDDGMRKALRFMGLLIVLVGSLLFCWFMYDRYVVAKAIAKSQAEELHKTKCNYYHACPVLPLSHATDVDTIKKCESAAVICNIDIETLAKERFMPPLDGIYGNEFTFQERITLACLAAFFITLGWRLVISLCQSSQTPHDQPLLYSKGGYLRYVAPTTKLNRSRQQRLFDQKRKRVDLDIPDEILQAAFHANPNS